VYRDRITGSPDALAGLFAYLLGDPRGCVFVADMDGVITGGICGHVFDHPMSGERVAAEVGWWMEPDSRGHGIRLFKAFEAWASSAGASAVQMVAPNERVAAFYARVGYEPIETTYQRRVA
jgi:GNAT superfamily N-acetyltransferase